MTHQPLYAGHALLVEDDPFMQQSVASFLADLGFTVSSATTHAQAMSLLHDKTNAFSLATLDLSLPEHSNEDTAPRTPLGLAIARHVKQTRPQIGVVVWSAYTHHLPDILALIEEGYSGLAFVPKGSRANTLRRAVALVLTGDVYLPAHAIGRSVPEATMRFLQSLRPDVARATENVEARLDQLTPRQYEVATLLALRPEAIAKTLGLSEKTVRNYLDDVYDILHLKDHDTELQDFRREALITLAVLLHRLRDR